MIAVLTREDFPSIEDWDGLAEGVGEKATSLTPDLSNVKREQMISAFNREFENSRKDLLIGATKWPLTTAFVFQACYAYSSTFRQLVDKYQIKSGTDGEIFPYLMGVTDTLSEVEVANVIRQSDWLLSLLVSHWLLIESGNREKYSYINWAFSLARESGVEKGGLHGNLLKSEFGDKIGNVDVSYTGGLHFTLALGPLQMSKGWFSEIVSTFQGKANTINVSKYFSSIATLPWYCYPLMESLYMRRNLQNFPSLKIFPKTALFASHMKDIKIRDAWFNSFWTLQPGLLAKGNIYTISDPDYLGRMDSVMRDYFDFEPWDDNIYQFVARGPLQKGFMAERKSNVLLNLMQIGVMSDETILTENTDALARAYEANMESFPLGTAASPPGNIDIKNEFRTILESVRLFSQSSSDYQEDKSMQQTTTPLFINYLKIIK